MTDPQAAPLSHGVEGEAPVTAQDLSLPGDDVAGPVFFPTVPPQQGSEIAAG